MGGFSDVMGESLTNLAASIVDAPTKIINSAGGAGSSVVGNTGGFLGGLFNFGTGAAVARNTYASSNPLALPANLQGSLQYGGGESFLSRNKGLLMFVFGFGVFAFILVKIFGKKKKVGVRRRRTTTTTTRSKTFRARSVGKKGKSSTTFKKVSQATYNGYTRKQKNLYNLKKARAVRKKNSK